MYVAKVENDPKASRQKLLRSSSLTVSVEAYVKRCLLPHGQVAKKRFNDVWRVSKWMRNGKLKAGPWSSSFVGRVLHAGSLAVTFTHSPWANMLTFDLDWHNEGEEDLDNGWEFSVLSEVNDEHARLNAEAGHRVGMDDFDAYIDASMSVTKSEARRRVNARRFAEIVAWILRVFPYAYVEESSRGLHVTILLDRKYDVEDTLAARDVVLKLLGLRDGCGSVEVFPKPCGRLLRHCRFPLSGKHRLLDADEKSSGFLVANLNSSRADDFRDLARGIRAELEVVVEDAEREIARMTRVYEREKAVARDHEQTSARGRVDRDIKPQKSKTGSSSSTSNEGKKREPTSRIFAVEVLHDEEYVLAVEGYSRHIPDDRCYDATQKIAFAFALDYREWGVERAMAGFRKILERPGHGATHCQSVAGIDAAVRTFKNRFNLYRLECPALIRNPRLLNVVESALGIPLTPLRKLQDASKKRKGPQPYSVKKEAGKKSWVTRRAGVDREAAKREERDWLDSFFERAA
jgi:hypothetical protein